MARLEKGNKIGKRFSKEYQPQRNGRKPTRMNELIDAFDLDDELQKISKEDAYKLMAHLLSCNMAQLGVMSRNPNLPTAILCQIAGIFSDIKECKTATVDKLMDRVYGKAPLTMEVTGTKGIPLTPSVPTSRVALQKLLKNMQGEKE